MDPVRHKARQRRSTMCRFREFFGASAVLLREPQVNNAPFRTSVHSRIAAAGHV